MADIKELENKNAFESDHVRPLDIVKTDTRYSTAFKTKRDELIARLRKAQTEQHDG